MVTHKICSKCGVDKPAAEFHLCRRAKSGLKSCCRACCRLYKRVTRDREMNRLYAIEWRAANREHYRRYQREYSAKQRLQAALRSSDNTVG